MVTKDNQKKSLNASIKEVTAAIDKQARQNLSKNPTKTPSPKPILKKRLAALQKKRNELNKNNEASPMNYSMQTRSQSKSSRSRRSSVGSANTPLTSIQKEMVSVIKKLGFPRGNSTELRGNKSSLKFIKNNKGEERVRVGQEAKNAQNAMNLRGVSRRLAAEAGAISPLYGIKKTLKLRRSDRIQNQKKASKSPNSKGSATKKPKNK
tara:strand:- start:1864 stop:2487 length:624 start_codon:yes stop_codon:yes gene_type:complete